MFTRTVRIILGIIQFSAFAWAITEGQTILSLLFLGTAIFNFISFLRSGTVPLALLYIKKNNPLKAKSVIHQIFDAKYLSSKNKSYYNFALGYISLFEKKQKDSLSFFKNSLENNGLNRKDWFICVLNILDLSKKLNLKTEFNAYKDLIDRKDYFPEDLKSEYNRITK